MPSLNGAPKQIDLTPANERKEQLAINLYDLDRVPAAQREKLQLASRLGTQAIKMDWDRKEAKDEVAVAFKCSLLEAAMICDLIRSHDKRLGEFPIRVYLKRKEWSRVPSKQQLTIVDAQLKVVLNPEVFTPERPEKLVSNPIPYVPSPDDGEVFTFG